MGISWEKGRKGEVLGVPEGLCDFDFLVRGG